MHDFHLSLSLPSSSHPRPQVRSETRRSFTPGSDRPCLTTALRSRTAPAPSLGPSPPPEVEMECTITSYNPGPPPVSRMKYMKADTTKTVLHVNFEPEKGEVQERKKKYLTAKYGQHQMNLIRKRLRVEMWMFDQLQALYGHRDEDSTSYDIEIDLDELLDIEGDFNRKAWLGGKVIGAKKSQENVEKFISELLQRAKTL